MTAHADPVDACRLLNGVPANRLTAAALDTFLQVAGFRLFQSFRWAAFDLCADEDACTLRQEKPDSPCVLDCRCHHRRFLLHICVERAVIECQKPSQTYLKLCLSLWVSANAVPVLACSTGGDEKAKASRNAAASWQSLAQVGTNGLRLS